MLKLSFCDCIDVYILVKGTITVTKQGAESVALKTDKNVKPTNKWYWKTILRLLTA